MSKELDEKVPVVLEACTLWEHFYDAAQATGAPVVLSNPYKTRLIAEASLKTDTYHGSDAPRALERRPTCALPSDWAGPLTPICAWCARESWRQPESRTTDRTQSHATVSRRHNRSFAARPFWSVIQVGRPALEHRVDHLQQLVSGSNRPLPGSTPTTRALSGLTDV